MHSDWKPDVRQQPVKYAVKPLPGKDWKMGMFASSLCAEPWETVMADAHMPGDNSLFALVLWNL